MNQLHPIFQEAIQPFMPGFQRCGCVARPATIKSKTADFIANVKAGNVPPADIADAIYAMHAALIDHFPAVGLWLPNDLEHVADSVVKAIEIQDRQEQDHPEKVAL